MNPNREDQILDVDLFGLPIIATEGSAMAAGNGEQVIYTPEERSLCVRNANEVWTELFTEANKLGIGRKEWLDAIRDTTPRA